MKKRLFLFIVVLSLFAGMEIALAEKEIPLSLSECLGISLANNLDIKIAKVESRMKAEDVLRAESMFDAVLTGKATYGDDRRASSSIFSGSKNVSVDYELGVSKLLPTGTEIDIDYSDNRYWTDSQFVVNNPLHTAGLSLSVSQSLLKNFFGYVDVKTVKLSKIEKEMAGLDSLSRIENAVAEVEKAYWHLVFTYENLAMRKELLKQAEELYAIYEGHFKTGFAENTELYELETNVRIRKTELAIAENELRSSRNRLELLLNMDREGPIAPKDNLTMADIGADLTESLREALLANRGYLSKKKELKGKNIALKMKENSLWPEIDLVGTYAVNGVDRKFEKANGRLTTDKHPYYYGGVRFTVPIENNAARSDYNKALLEKEKVILELIKVEKEVINNIDDGVRAVNLNLENAKRWQKIRELEKLKFEEEKKKLAYGRSNSKTLIDYQGDLTMATLNQYSAILSYRYALIDLENAKDTLLNKVGITDYDNF
ncbi:MAG: TolC family protein [Candidatus Omnitrophica bacterium]|nr:TolC family protein [Candidatus Omnitrophota bacterium]